MPVYFIQAVSGPVKIGFSETPGNRLNALQAATHEQLTLIRTLGGTHADERWLHQYFSARHIRGEWFEYSEKMREVEVIPNVYMQDTSDDDLESECFSESYLNNYKDSVYGPYYDIRAQRNRLGWSQKELAKTLEVSQSHLCEMEKGCTAVSQRTAMAMLYLCIIHGVDQLKVADAA